ncbi:phospholipid carrier-dependent glycosyltransferase [Streptomyces populi]|uniref:Phospholipid carrier-dependent glycosyltransferase n=1 Tax=Streptomyces populi TaxID=2058924 RepID=A0A2I0SDL2_9ACTN|nr:phospholipid carrier-dependent glycosyltransferase [Streptomyces populi]PKT68006.1 phospholipid carrier-dependent glycosyltransferase [Streptomyces populi]
MAVAMVSTAVEQTPTIDEPVYVGTATVYLQQHDLRYNPEHPPLGKLVIAAGLLFAHPHLDPAFEGDQTELGRHVLYESGDDPWRVMLWARLPVIVLTLLFGLVVLAFARELAGRTGALVALALYAFSPDVIAHGSLATFDVPASGFLLTSVWLMWRAGRRPSLYLPLSATALGAAVATKTSMLPAVPVVLLLAVVSVWRAGGPGRGTAPGSGTRARVRLLGLAAAAAAGTAVTAVAVVWATYLAVDPRLRWTAPADLPAVHGPRALLIGHLPLPQPYRDGMRIQFGFEDATWQGFLFGRLYRGSLWYYLPAALLVKTPIGTAALWAAGSSALLSVRRLRPAVPYLLLPPALLLASAMTGSRDLGVRYALFVPVFLAVVAGCAVVAVRGRRPARTGGVRWRPARTGGVRWRPGWAGAATAALVLFAAVSSVLTYPYYLTYSNEAFGGPEKTYLRLHDSNVDWGQDLGRLADRLEGRHPHEKVWFVYKGAGVPSAYGIHAADPLTVPADRVHGLLVVSDTSIDKAGTRLKALLATSRRIDEVGHSITLFRRP